MGADMLIEFVIIKENDTPDNLKNRILDRIGKLTEKDIDTINAYFEEMLGRNLNDAETDLAEIKETLTDITKDCIALIEGEHRDIAWISHKGDMIYVSGGMSWGDSPTDAYDRFYQFNELLTHFEWLD